MTTNKPEMVAYARTGALGRILPRPWRLPVVSDWSPMYSDALIRLSDYEALQAECEQLRKDKVRLDWLADPDNAIGNVELPEKAVLENVHCLRAAIDAAMEGGEE